MVKLLIVNGSPRAPRSNSRRYAELFQARWKGEARYAALTAKNHAELAAAAADCTDLLLVFPPYADGLPAPLLRFLEFLEGAGPEHRPRISVLINCGFLEPHQNDVAVDMVRLFCLENGYPFGACLKIGGGEAILGTPFAFRSGGASGRWPGPSPPDGPPSWRSPCPCPPAPLCGPPHATGRRWAPPTAVRRNRWRPWTLSRSLRKR